MTVSHETTIEIAEEVHRRLIGYTLLPDEATELLQILEYEILTRTHDQEGPKAVRFRVQFTVEIDAKDRDEAYSIGVNSVEGFPPTGVEVQCLIDGVSYPAPGDERA